MRVVGKPTTFHVMEETMIGNGGKPTSWYEVAALLITSTYRLVALWLLRDLWQGQRELEKLIEAVGRLSPQ